MLQAVQQGGHGVRVVEGGVGGGPAGQRGGLLVRARLPQAVQQAATWCGSSRAARAAARPASAAACSYAPACRRLSSSKPTARGLSRAAWAAVTGQQRAGLLVRARLLQAVQQSGYGVRVVEGGVGGGPAGQRGGLLVRARLPQAVQQPGHTIQVVEGGVGGGPAG